MNQPEVTILCTTYNHAPYIEKTIESFLDQQTTFEFEIIVHDDASTDGTQEILKQYEKKHHGKIRVIYEEINQFNKLPRGGYFQGLMEPLAKGRYIALCEGDDYWIDEKKIQKQYDFLESQAKYVCCGGASLVVSSDNPTDAFEKITCGTEPCDISSEDIISGKMFQTATVFYRKGLGEDYAANWNIPKIVGDFPWLLYLSLRGKVYYFSDFLAAYRVGGNGSYSSETNRDKLFQRNLELIELCDALDALTEYKYRNLFLKRKIDYAYKAGIFKGLSFFNKTKSGRALRFRMPVSKLGMILLHRAYYYIRTIINKVLKQN